MIPRRLFQPGILVCCVFFGDLLRADVQVPGIFSDHMVLQKAVAVPIWGMAVAGEAITVTVDRATAKATAGNDGKWKAVLDLSQEDPGPFTMTVAGTNTLTIADVAIGEVWLASGQSNMTMQLRETAGATEEIAGSADPLFRSFLEAAPEARPANEPQVDATAEGKWIVAGPDKSGSFTAIGYYFGKSLRTHLKVPVGIIHASVGGTAIESWLSPEGFDLDPGLKEVKDRVLGDASTYPKRLADFVAKYHAWEKQNNRFDHPHDAAQFAARVVPLDGWKPVQAGQPSTMGLSDSGATWFRCTMILPHKEADTYVPVFLDHPADFDEVYWNGTRIGKTTADATTSSNFSDGASNGRRYDAWPALISEGDNVLAVRVFSPGGHAVFTPPRVVSSISFRPLLQKGDWMAKTEFEYPPLNDEAMAAYPVRPLTPPAAKARPAHLFQAMIQPLVSYGIRGFIWDQGEANSGRSFQYRTEFQLLIQDWRKKWGMGDLPFYFIQMQNGGLKSTIPTATGGAEMREAQAAALKLPNTGMGVTIDLGEEANAHYKDKKDAGERLALPALAKTYGVKLPYAGPTYDSMSVQGDKIRVSFLNADGGLVARPLPDTYQPNSILPATKPLVMNSPGSEVQGFTICGDDHQWVWADATIDGTSVVVSSPKVPHPVAVRYAWADNPTCNLYNGAGLPAGPFRTDDLPYSTMTHLYGK
jgi:sialate O-acetylesterase